MKKLITLCMFIALAVTVSAQARTAHIPSFSSVNGYSYDTYPDHFVFHYKYDSSTVLPVTMEIAINTYIGDTPVLDSLFTDTTLSNVRTMYFATVPAPRSAYAAIFVMNNDSGYNRISYYVTTAGPSGIDGISTDNALLYWSGRTLHAAASNVAMKVLITDMVGNIVIESSNETIDLGSLPAGAYLAVRQDAISKTVKKIVLE